jgi:hypothetical protein
MYIGVGMVGVATVKTVLENPRSVRNVSDSKNESFFGVEIAHLLVMSLLISTCSSGNGAKQLEYINRSDLRMMRERTVVSANGIVGGF